MTGEELGNFLWFLMMLGILWWGYHYIKSFMK